MAKLFGTGNIKFGELSKKNFIELLNYKNDCDVIIEVKYKEESFTEFANIIEGGIVNLVNVESLFIFELILVADEFGLEELASKLETFPIETKAFWLRILILQSLDFNSLPESLLVSLLKRDAGEARDSIGPYKKILNKQFWKDINLHLSSPERLVKSSILPARSFSVIVSEILGYLLLPRSNNCGNENYDCYCENSYCYEKLIRPYQVALVLPGLPVQGNELNIAE
ncbi:hypothetical protein Glove_57g127 [Diversispora epigaea]|uniref:BTB domain-containing protein n=1 Tax=Diversispora epigaea TaxID=1348612 RepID=A0A397JNC6_9GLOM|nr:hypothetical protein Glove_57g127 [Diversispora epigaea]